MVVSFLLFSFSFIYSSTQGETSDSRIKTLLNVVEGKISDNKKSDAYLELGDIHTQAGKTQEALNYYLSAYYYGRSKHRKIAALERLSEINHKYGSVAKSIEFTEEAVNLMPKDIVLRKKLAGYYEEAELWQNAVEEYRRIMKISPKDDKEVIYHLAAALERLGIYTEAIEYYKKLLFLSDISIVESKIIKRRLAACYEKISDFALAEALLKESLSKEEEKISTISDAFWRYNNYEGYMSLGRLYYSMGNYASASESFSSAIKLAHNELKDKEGLNKYCEALIMTAVSYIKSERYEEALEIVGILRRDDTYIITGSTISMAYVDRTAQDWKMLSHFFCGVALYKMGDRSSAKVEFSTAETGTNGKRGATLISGISSIFKNYFTDRNQSSDTSKEEKSIKNQSPVSDREILKKKN